MKRLTRKGYDLQLAARAMHNFLKFEYQCTFSTYVKVSVCICVVCPVLVSSLGIEVAFVKRA